MDYSMLQHSLSKEQYYAPETGVSQGVYHWFQTLQNTDVSAIQKKPRLVIHAVLIRFGTKQLPEGSMGLVYSPTWSIFMVNVEVDIPVPSVLWAI